MNYCFGALLVLTIVLKQLSRKLCPCVLWEHLFAKRHIQIMSSESTSLSKWTQFLLLSQQVLFKRNEKQEGPVAA